MRQIFKKVISVWIVLSFLTQTFVSDACLAQAATIPSPQFLAPSSHLSLPVLRGIQLNAENPLEFNFFIDAINTHDVSAEESQKLIAYFLTALAVPKEQLWVNLSPYEKDRIIEEGFSSTEMGKDLLIQDYFLKQLTASLTHPDTESGRVFWEKMYEKLYALGYSDLPDGIFNKVWIMPDKAIIQEVDQIAYIEIARLKVMMEEDYLAMSKNGYQAKTQGSGESQTDAHHISSRLTRDIILPIIEEEINNGETFAPLRQIYHSLVLAIWFKKRLSGHLLNQAYADQKKLSGIQADQTAILGEVYQKYSQAFTQGAYDIIKEDYHPESQDIAPRHYFSGGFGVQGDEFVKTQAGDDSAMMSLGSMIKSGSFVLLTVALSFLSPSAVVAQQDSIENKPTSVFVQTGTSQNPFEKNIDWYSSAGFENVRIPRFKRLSLDGNWMRSRFENPTVTIPGIGSISNYAGYYTNSDKTLFGPNYETESFQYDQWSLSFKYRINEDIVPFFSLISSNVDNVFFLKKDGGYDFLNYVPLNASLGLNFGTSGWNGIASGGVEIVFPGVSREEYNFTPLADKFSFVPNAILWLKLMYGEEYEGGFYEMYGGYVSEVNSFIMTHRIGWGGERFGGDLSSVMVTQTLRGIPSNELTRLFNETLFPLDPGTNIGAHIYGNAGRVKLDLRAAYNTVRFTNVSKWVVSAGVVVKISNAMLAQRQASGKNKKALAIDRAMIVLGNIAESFRATGGVDLENAEDSLEIRGIKTKMSFPQHQTEIVVPSDLRGIKIQILNMVPLKRLSQLDEKYQPYDQESTGYAKAS